MRQQNGFSGNVSRNGTDGGKRVYRQNAGRMRRWPNLLKCLNNAVLSTHTHTENRPRNLTVRPRALPLTSAASIIQLQNEMRV